MESGNQTTSVEENQNNDRDIVCLEGFKCRMSERLEALRNNKTVKNNLFKKPANESSRN